MGVVNSYWQLRKLVQAVSGAPVYKVSPLVSQGNPGPGDAVGKWRICGYTCSFVDRCMNPCSMNDKSGLLSEWTQYGYQ